MRLIESDTVELKEVYVDDVRKTIVAFANTNGGTVYVRQGASSAPASDDSIRRMIKETDGDIFESMRSMNQELTFVEAENAFARQGVEWGDVQMKTLGLVNSENLYTNLGLLLSDQCPHIIKAAMFRGETQDEFQDRKEFGGSIFKQMNDAYEYLNMRNQKKATFEGLYRIDSMDYDDSAIREVLFNAVIHRDYSNMAPTIVSVYSNRLEVITYGGLPGGVTLEDALIGLSVCRNIKLANVFYRLKMVEAYGTGLQKICNSYGESRLEPKFIAGPHSFKVIMPNKNAAVQEKADDLDEDDKQVLNYVKERGSITREEIEHYMEISSSTAVRMMKRLRDAHLIKTVGNGKNTRYTT